MNDELPCLDLLEATPAILRGLMAEISEDDARWKPADDRFSIAEVLSHLSHSEGHCYRARDDRFLAEEYPEFRAGRRADASRRLSKCRSGGGLRALRGPARDEHRAAARAARRNGESKGTASFGGRDHAVADAPRVGAARHRPHPPDRGTGAGAKVSRRHGSIGRRLSIEAMTIRRILLALSTTRWRSSTSRSVCEETR